MGTAEPRIAILMAVYEPRLDWLRAQLTSLNAQTWPNLRLYIRDDASPTVPIGEIRHLAESCVTAFPFTVERNEENLGSNGTFARLTGEAEGAYFAYCDQDDVWLPEKLEALQKALENESAQMAYCDMSVIDGEGVELAPTLRALRPRLRYVSGEGLAETYFFRNCTAGCSMLLRSETARTAMPFPKETYCDQWLAICAARAGAVAFVDRPLLRYRQHGANQTGVLAGVTDKASYRRLRLEPLRERLAFYQAAFGRDERLEAFVRGRLEGDLRQIWRGRAFSPMEARFEIAARFMPDKLFQRIVR